MSTVRQSSPGATCIAIKFIRGVGDAEADASLKSCLPLLEAADVDTKDVEEINWSWQAFVPKAYARNSSDSLVDVLERYDVVDHHFLRRVGAAVRTAAMMGLEPASNAPFLLNAVRNLCFSVLQQVPSLTVLMIIAAAAGLEELTLVISTVIAAAAGASLLLCAVPAFRKSVHATVRAITLLLLWPIVYFVTFPATRFAVYVVIGTACFIVPLSLSWAIVGDWHVREAPGPAGIPAYDDLVPSIVGYLVVAILMFALTAVCVAVYSQLRLRLSPLLKLLADVALYLGDSKYRLNLWQHVVDSLMRSKEKGALRFFLLTHSLGSVICIDVLRYWCITPPVSITLITGGSPLRRFFHRFFPANYPAPAQLLAEMSGRFPSFKWVNVYRPHDPVGTSLGLPPAWDISTGQNHLDWGVKAHLNYWSDKLVYSLANAAMRVELPSTGAPHPPTTQPPPLTPQIPHRGGLWVRFTVYGGLCWLLCWLSWGWFVAPLNEAARQSQELADYGVPARGQLYVYTDRVRGGDRGLINVPAPRYTITYDVQGTPYTQFVDGDRCDRRLLGSLFPASSAPTIVRHPDGQHDAAAVDTDVVYSKENPRLFEIPRCKRGSLPASYRAWSYAAFAFSVPLIIILSYGVVRGLMVPALAALAGLTAEQFRKVKKASIVEPQDLRYLAVSMACASLFLVAATLRIVVTLS